MVLAKMYTCLVYLGLIGTAVGFANYQHPLTKRYGSFCLHHFHVSSKHINNNYDDDALKLADKAMHSALLGAAVTSSVVVPDICNAQVSSMEMQSFITCSSVQSMTSVQLATTTPMGDLPAESGINPAFSTFGQWFFLLYVVVSLLAGGKEVFNRIRNQMDKDD